MYTSTCIQVHVHQIDPLVTVLPCTTCTLEPLRFPVRQERRCTPVKSTKTVELFCTCRMPKEKVVDIMTECDSCREWDHHQCMDIPSEAFGPDDVKWKCKACCTSTLLHSVCGLI